jgi:tetratricopeptide (TPR) repeat protein
MTTLRSCDILILVLVIVIGKGGISSALAATEEANVYVARGILEYDEKNYPEAVRNFEEALRLDAQNLDALYYLALVRIAQENYPEAAALLERARAKDPQDENVAFQLGVARFALEEYDRAEPLLRQAFGSDPSRENLGYYLGFLAFRGRDYAGALRYLKANVSRDPSFLQLARYYRGLSLSALGLREEAEAEVEEALRTQPVSPLTGPAERIRDAFRAARRAERRFRLEARASLFYDDNVRVNPTAGAEPNVEFLRRNKTRSTGELLFVRGEYEYLKTDAFTATALAAALHTFNNNIPDFNIADYLGGLNWAYRSSVRGMPYVLGLQYAFDFLTLDQRQFVRRHTATPYVSLVENTENLTTIQYRFQDKEFLSDRDVSTTAEIRDAFNHMIGILHFFRFAADRHFIKVGYQFDDEAAKGEDYKYLGHRVVAGFRYTLPWDVRFDFTFEYHRRKYASNHLILKTAPDGTPNERRKDWEQTYQASLSKDIRPNLTVSLEGFTVVNNSNFEIFDYTRNVVSLAVTWRY